MQLPWGGSSPRAKELSADTLIGGGRESVSRDSPQGKQSCLLRAPPCLCYLGSKVLHVGSKFTEKVVALMKEGQVGIHEGQHLAWGERPFQQDILRLPVTPPPTSPSWPQGRVASRVQPSPAPGTHFPQSRPRIPTAAGLPSRHPYTSPSCVHWIRAVLEALRSSHPALQKVFAYSQGSAHKQLTLQRAQYIFPSDSGP